MNQIEATASVAGSIAAPAFDDIEADIRGSGDSRLRLAGSFRVGTQGAVRVEWFDVISNLEVTHISDVADLFGIDGAGPERFWFEGKLSGDDRRLDADGQAKLGETQFDGVLTGDFNAARPSFKGHLHSPRLRLIDLGLTAAAAAAPTPAPQATAIAKPELFGREPFPLDSLRKMALDMEVRLDSLEGIAFAIEQAKAHVTLTEGRLQLSGVRFDVVNGYAEVNAEVDRA